MTCSVATVVSPDVVSCAATNGNFNYSHVATATQVTATATISGSAVSNYTLGAGGTTVSVSSTSVSAPSNITTRPVTATLTAQNKVYDGTNTEPNASMTCALNNAVPGDGSGCVATAGTFNSSQVLTATTVTATATLNGPTASDYTFGAGGTAVSIASPSPTATASITPATASVTPTVATKVYGQSDPALSGTLHGFVMSDNVTAAYSRVAGQNVGNYLISAILSPAGVLSNYTIAYNTANFSITPATLTGATQPVSYVYGTVPVSPISTVVYSGFVNGDTLLSVTFTGTLMCVSSATATSDVGTYPITCSGQSAGSNYSIMYVAGVLTITPASQTINFGSLPNIPYSATPLMVSATATSGLAVTFTASGSCTVTPAGAVTFTNIGTCTITANQGGTMTILLRRA